MIVYKNKGVFINNSTVNYRDAKVVGLKERMILMFIKNDQEIILILNT